MKSKILLLIIGEFSLHWKKKADIISHLNLYFMHNNHTLEKILPKFHKLKSLIINGLEHFNEGQLKMCVYRDLEIFKIHLYDSYDLKAASIIIENSGE
ncbi:hypothetical protein RclHR1_08150008 [Rhizophagus clarus]|uniref:Uncharacterized protein n=1 Tax=Rhizophagus clarus TaxID=94130 RepID=A0A2Z6SML9_9GLOM|nr:hypothetical protein RclHR1_08150008 [Rhizophagus clarus]GET04867.1 hypothetical protein RCL_e26184_RclHR1_08150008 [Rhizophagus clarus]